MRDVSYENIFRRYELKYLITAAQRDRLLQTAERYMEPDRYGRSTIRNIYFDTDNYRIIRRSIEAPAYKEKLRMRSYCRADGDTPVFAELKKKYHSVVYKRRISLGEADAENWLCGGAPCPVKTQIADEIDYFRSFYETLRPAVFLSYEREAFFSKEDSSFRITFDENILCRRDRLTLAADAWGTPLLADGQVLMEIKTSGGMPLWLTSFLTSEQIYKTSFSKYGTAYRELIFPELKENFFYV